MSDDLVNIQISVSGDYNNAVIQMNEAIRLEGIVGKTKGKFETLAQKVGLMANGGLAISHIASVYNAIGNAVAKCTIAYEAQSVAGTKLAAVMQKTIGASSEEIESVRRLTNEQQELGVISNAIQTAGTQELATYVGKTDSIKKLIPAINDMAAQQYGLNATQENYTQLAGMVGKVMQGQTGALSRYGYSFTEAQEKILKFGNEQQRAAVLADVIGQSVGGVNKALAETPEGRLKQHSNSMVDLQARIGKLAVSVQYSFLPLWEKVGEIVEKITLVFEQHREKIMAVTYVVASVLGKALEWLWSVVNNVGIVIMWFINSIRDANPVFISITAAVIGMTAALTTYNSVMAAYNTVTTITKAIQSGLLLQLIKTNLAFLASPVFWIIAGVVALAAVITFLAVRIKGWGTIWEATISFCKNIIMAFVEVVKLYFQGLENAIVLPLDQIRKKWYEFKLATGIGDEKENVAIARINADIDQRINKMKETGKKIAEYGKASKNSFKNVKLELDDSVTMSGMVGKFKNQLGITDNTAVTNNNLTTALSTELSNSSESISSGGRSVKNFNITINDGLIKQVDNHFGNTGESPESASDFMWKLSSSLQMILNDVNYAAE